MEDSDAKLSWRLANIAGRLDWWNIRNEHTPFEWACQLARAAVEPWGDERDDLRHAANTVRTLIANAAHEMTDEQVNHLFRDIAHYLKSNSQPDEPLSPAAARAAHG